MPERTALGKKAMEYLSTKEDVETAQDNLLKVKEALIIEFKKAKQKSIKIEGRTVSYSHDEVDKIKATTKGGGW